MSVGMNASDFRKYVKSFYGPGGIYDMGATEKQIDAAVKEYIASGADYAADSLDREHVRDILIKKYGLKFPA